MLIDQHFFNYHASVPWPLMDHDPQINWVAGVEVLEDWLYSNVGQRLSLWAWSDGKSSYKIGVSFKWEKDCSLFLLKWS